MSNFLHTFAEQLGEENMKKKYLFVAISIAAFIGCAILTHVNTALAPIMTLLATGIGFVCGDCYAREDSSEKIEELTKLNEDLAAKYAEVCNELTRPKKKIVIKTKKNKE